MRSGSAGSSSHYVQVSVDSLVNFQINRTFGVNMGKRRRTPSFSSDSAVASRGHPKRARLTRRQRQRFNGDKIKSCATQPSNSNGRSGQQYQEFLPERDLQPSSCPRTEYWNQDEGEAVHPVLRGAPPRSNPISERGHCPDDEGRTQAVVKHNGSVGVTSETPSQENANDGSAPEIGGGDGHGDSDKSPASGTTDSAKEINIMDVVYKMVEYKCLAREDGTVARQGSAKTPSSKDPRRSRAAGAPEAEDSPDLPAGIETDGDASTAEKSAQMNSVLECGKAEWKPHEQPGPDSQATFAKCLNSALTADVTWDSCAPQLTHSVPQSMGHIPQGTYSVIQGAGRFPEGGSRRMSDRQTPESGSYSVMEPNRRTARSGAKLEVRSADGRLSANESSSSNKYRRITVPPKKAYTRHTKEASAQDLLQRQLHICAARESDSPMRPCPALMPFPNDSSSERSSIWRPFSSAEDRANLVARSQTAANAAEDLQEENSRDYVQFIPPGGALLQLLHGVEDGGGRGCEDAAGSDFLNVCLPQRAASNLQEDVSSSSLTINAHQVKADQACGDVTAICNSSEAGIARSPHPSDDSACQSTGDSTQESKGHHVAPPVNVSTSASWPRASISSKQAVKASTLVGAVVERMLLAN